MVLRAHRQPRRTGREGMVSERGVARTDLAPRGKVSVHGEIWDAVSEAPVAAGQQVEVVGDRRAPAARAAAGEGSMPFEMPFGFLAVVDRPRR